MKKFTLLVPLIVALMFMGCSTTRTPLPELHAKVLKAEKKWADEAKLKRPKDFDVFIVERERRMYEKVIASDAPDWHKRRAGWNYIIAVNEALVPSIPRPPGRGTYQENPFY